MQNKSLKILLADPHPVTRNGLRWVVSSSRFSNAELYEAGSVDEISRAMEQSPIDLLVTEVAQPDVDGVDWLLNVRTACPDAGIIVHSALDHDMLIHHLFRMGVRAFVAKHSEAFHLVEALLAVTSGNRYVASKRGAIDDFSTDVAGTKARNYLGLTRRQQQLVGFLAAGNKSSEIADKLGISIRSVETYRSKLLQKLKIKNSSELISLGIKTGIIRM